MSKTFIPHLIHTVVDFNYGEPITHESYNQYLNLNIDQGDYNTQVLDELLNNLYSEYHILYLDKALRDLDAALREAIANEAALRTAADNSLQDQITVNATDIATLRRWVLEQRDLIQELEDYVEARLGKIDDKIKDSIEPDIATLKTNISSINTSLQNINKDIQDLNKNVEEIEESITVATKADIDSIFS